MPVLRGIAAVVRFTLCRLGIHGPQDHLGERGARHVYRCKWCGQTGIRNG